MGERDIERAAAEFIKIHGQYAWLEAYQRADKARADGDEAAVRLWKRVAFQIDRLQAKLPD